MAAPRVGLWPLDRCQVRDIHGRHHARRGLESVFRSSSFISDGPVHIYQVFPRERADAARAILWKTTGCSPDDAGDLELQPVIRLGMLTQAPFSIRSRRTPHGCTPPSISRSVEGRSALAPAATGSLPGYGSLSAGRSGRRWMAHTTLASGTETPAIHVDEVPATSTRRAVRC